MPGIYSYLCTLALASSLVNAKTINVKVANGGLNYDPDTIRAEVGDEVAFLFTTGTHDVTLGQFDKPCQFAPDAFWSGQINIPANTRANATFTIPIMDRNTKWIYCSVGRHCQRGMVGVINPPSGGNQNIGAFKNAAKEAPESNHPTAINGGSINIGGDIQIPGFPGNPSTSSTPSGTSSQTSSTSQPTGSETTSATVTRRPSSSATGSATASGSSTPRPTSNAAVSTYSQGVFNAVLAIVAVGGTWCGLM
ncbi:hypothetical protein LOZ53_002941 [Ophidiomyces ophidiicola]|nr:hypothetical protein LOZ55_005432 [Ophidiomyces ophidiicola]KAI1988637.1 hypothetical protein LOZ51_005454 [Ophidiomyces ophidiicola]KAI1991259.1 hypothetical protein LOZ53_002941 [Ophidiomyces ophidiicola]